MDDEIWVIGATGRAGSAIVSRLVTAGCRVVLVGRDRGRLQRVAESYEDAAVPPRCVPAAFDEVPEALGAGRPRVVVHTVGPFARTARTVVDACPEGTHYVDIGNELPGTEAVLAAAARGTERGSTYVTGAGFGVLGTESVLLRLCGGDRVPARVRVDAVASVALEEGLFGEALARSIVEGLADGGRRVHDGAMARGRVGVEAEVLTTPDGDRVTTAAFPSGELLAAWRGSGAPDVLAASSEVPHGLLAAAVPALGQLTRIGALRRVAVDRLGAMRLRARPAPRAHSWARARVTWRDGGVSEGWLRAGEGMEFTASAAATVAQHLAAGDGRPGAFTPAALFGPGVAERAGASFVDGTAG